MYDEDYTLITDFENGMPYPQNGVFEKHNLGSRPDRLRDSPERKCGDSLDASCLRRIEFLVATASCVPGVAGTWATLPR